MIKTVDIQGSIEAEIKKRLEDFHFEHTTTIHDHAISTGTLTEDQIIQSILKGNTINLTLE